MTKRRSALREMKRIERTNAASKRTGGEHERGGKKQKLSEAGRKNGKGLERPD